MVLATAEGVAAITAGATLLAASGLAYVTIHTTKLRLGEERERQERALAAEAERQTAALSHDRELADIADLRQLLDEAASALDRATDAQSSGASVMGFPTELDLPKQELQRLVKSAKEEIEATVPPVVDLGARLRVRLGPDDPITSAFREASSALRQMQSMVMTLALGLTTDLGKEAEIARTADATFRAAVNAFVAAAVKRAGTAASRADV